MLPGGCAGAEGAAPTGLSVTDLRAVEWQEGDGTMRCNYSPPPRPAKAHYQMSVCMRCEAVETETNIAPGLSKNDLQLLGSGGIRMLNPLFSIS